MLPRVKIIFETGAIGAVEPAEDGTAGFVTTATAVVDKFSLGEAYLITSLDGLTDLGITSDGADVNKHIYDTVKDFYDEAPLGTKLWIFGVANTVSMADMCDKTLEYAKKLIEAANGDIKFIIVSRRPDVGYTPTILDGLDSDVYAAITTAQQLGEWATVEKYAPLFIVLEGRAYAGTPADLRDLSQEESNRVGILIGDKESDSGNAAMGVLGGRIALIPAQRSVARVKTGKLTPDTLYVKDKKPENAGVDIIHDKGFITFRTFVGKSGYFFTDDKLATAVSDDYALIPRRRVIDKAYRIAYQTMVEEIGEEIPVTDDGKIPATIVKNIQNTVENAIISNMTAIGNLGVDPSDPNDTGVECYIDINQNVVSTSLFAMKVRVKPFGYSKYVDIYLGYKTTVV